MPSFKTRISSRELLDNFGKDNIFFTTIDDPIFNYCERNGGAKYYNCGVYGWNYDVFVQPHPDDGHEVAIVAGYRYPNYLKCNEVYGGRLNMSSPYLSKVNKYKGRPFEYSYGEVKFVDPLPIRSGPNNY